MDLSTGAENIGLRTLSIKCNLQQLVEKVPLPCIVFWNENHFVVVYYATKRYLYVSDPTKGHVKYTHSEFSKGWIPANESNGVLLAVEPTSTFTDSEAEKRQQKDSFLSILKYFTPYKGNFALIFVVMLFVTLLQGVLPFISKAVIDVGIKTSDTNFINMVLVGNIAILVSVMVFNVLRDWILMHITTRVNIALISDYLIKLMKLPITFFEKQTLR